MPAEPLPEVQEYNARFHRWWQANRLLLVMYPRQFQALLRAHGYTRMRYMTTEINLLDPHPMQFQHPLYHSTITDLIVRNMV